MQRKKSLKRKGCKEEYSLDEGEMRSKRGEIEEQERSKEEQEMSKRGGTEEEQRRNREDICAHTFYTRTYMYIHI